LVVVKIIFDASIRSVFVVGARFEPIRLKLSGVIGFVSIRDVMVVNINKIVAGFIIHNFVESILNIVGRVGVDIVVVRELKTIFNEKLVFVRRCSILFKDVFNGCIRSPFE
jgi:hypothetical protein